MKKKITAVLLVGILCLSAFGCGKTEAENTMETGMKNPMKEVQKDELEKLGVKMNEPAQAEDMAYHTISDETAQITFTLDGHKYTYRGAKTDKDISGLYEEFVGDPVSFNVSQGDQNVEVTLKKTTSSAYLASWMWENVSYILYTADDVGDQVITELSAELAKSSCPNC